MVHETMVKMAAVILGEFGHLIHEKDGMSALEQCAVLFSKFPTVSVDTKNLLFSALCTLSIISPEVNAEA